VKFCTQNNISEIDSAFSSAIRRPMRKASRIGRHSKESSHDQTRRRFGQVFLTFGGRFFAILKEISLNRWKIIGLRRDPGIASLKVRPLESKLESDFLLIS